VPEISEILLLYGWTEQRMGLRKNAGEFKTILSLWKYSSDDMPKNDILDPKIVLI